MEFHFLQELLIHLPDIIRVVDEKGTFHFVNDSVKTILGYEPHDMVGRSMYDFIYERDRETASRSLNDLITKKESKGFELLWRDINGNYVPLETLMSIEHNGQSKPLYVFSCRDIREKKKTENELRQTNFELDSFVYRASHDIRAPLTSILGLIDLLKMDQDNKSKGEYLDLMERSVQRLDKSVSDLNFFSRNSRTPIIPQHINFQKLIHNSLEDFKFMPSAKKVKFIIEVNQNVEFLSDELRLKIIFNNFISNAIKYQRLHVDDPYVSINVNFSGNTAIITIKDNGKGIKEEYLDKIFDMFFRATQDSYGSGLGLYIVKQVVEKLNGKIDKVISVYGEGTEITISIPCLVNA